MYFERLETDRRNSVLQYVVNMATMRNLQVMSDSFQHAACIVEGVWGKAAAIRASARETGDWRKLRNEFHVNCARLGNYAASGGNFLRTFRDNLLDSPPPEDGTD